MTDFVAPTVDWAALSPVVIVLLAAVVGVLVEAFVPRPGRAARCSWPSRSSRWPARSSRSPRCGRGVEETGGTVVLGGSLLVDGPTLRPAGHHRAARARRAADHRRPHGDRARTRSRRTPPPCPGSDYEELARRKGVRQTEIYPLVLFATGGMLIFPAAGDLLTLFVALEVLSLPLYLLTGMARRRRLLSQEASMKYFLLGAFSSALLLFGIALVYGYSGSLRYSEIAEATHDRPAAWTACCSSARC